MPLPFSEHSELKNNCNIEICDIRLIFDRIIDWYIEIRKRCIVTWYNKFRFYSLGLHRCHSENKIYVIWYIYIYITAYFHHPIIILSNKSNLPETLPNQKYLHAVFVQSYKPKVLLQKLLKIYKFSFYFHVPVLISNLLLKRDVNYLDAWSRVT